MTEKFEKTIEFSPAYDRRDPDPKKDYGVGAVDIRFILKGKRGAVQFLLGTGWFLPETNEEYKARGVNLSKDYPRAWDIGYHSPKPMYEGHSPITDKCNILNGKCFYDGSTLNADPILNILLREGSDGVWKELEKYYHETFNPRKKRGGR